MESDNKASEDQRQQRKVHFVLGYVILAFQI